MLATKLHELQMENDGENEDMKKKVASPELDSLDKEIIQLTKEKDKSDELCQKVELVFD